MSDTIADFLIGRLINSGIKVVFGVPGESSDDFFELLWNNNKLKVVATTDEGQAGYAGDAYARVNGVGCVTVNYNVGAWKVANAVACAHAARSPLVVISISPPRKGRESNTPLGNLVRAFNRQREIFEKITCASAVLNDPSTAAYHVDRVFEALGHHKQPIYIELPKDIATRSVNYDVYKLGTPVSPKSDTESLKESINEVQQWLETSHRPVIMAGVELARYGMGTKLVHFAEKTGIPVVTELLSKSVISERHPLFGGVYCENCDSDITQKLVDESDCLIMLGIILTDVTRNFIPARFTKRQVVWCSVEGLRVRNHTYTDVQFKDFCDSLFKLDLRNKWNLDLPEKTAQKDFEPKNVRVTSARVFELIDSILTKEMAIVTDIGDSLYGGSGLTVHHSNQFLSPACFGFALSGAMGMQMANPAVRPIVVLGDGAFQRSITEISTILDLDLNPVVILLNNRGFNTEIFKDRFTQIRNWNYHNIKSIFNGGDGMLVETETELTEAVQKALDSKEVFVINVSLEQGDKSLRLKRMIEANASK